MYKRIKVKNIPIHLLTKRAAYLPSYKTMAVSDWHLNKLDDNTEYGKKSVDFDKEELDQFGELVDEYEPQRVVLLGNTFHPNWDADWQLLYDFAEKYTDIEFVFTQKDYPKEIAQKFGRLPNFRFVLQYILDHKICFSYNLDVLTSEDFLCIAGGELPGCIVSGSGGQMYRMPCFKVSNNVLVMPSYGKWTSLNILKKEKNTRLYAILGDHIASIKR
ncbi:MAG TPA: hypothetical protein VK102_07385 [Sphingobacterium sp.]|nr:hypothetical protein [Sphingobacterium sp.]